MRTSSNKTKMTTTIMVVLLMASITLTVVQSQIALASGAEPTNVQTGGSQPLPAGVTADVIQDTVAHLSVTPNPIGRNQPLLVNIWMTPSLVTCKYFTGFTVTFTKPDGTTAVIGPLDSNPGDATQWFQYTPDQVGNWTVQFDFPGGYFPAGNYSVSPERSAFGGVEPISIPNSVYFKPSSTPVQTLIVQEDMVYSWPPASLPTDTNTYWTRPIPMENREWWLVGGNYPQTGYPGSDLPEFSALYPDTNTAWSAQYNFNPWVAGSDSCHILWRRQGAIAGITGGSTTVYGTYAGGGTPTLIYAGRCYQTITLPWNGVVQSCAVCYDLRTGQIYYSIPTAEPYNGVTPTIISYPDAGDATNSQGEGNYGPTPELLAITNGRLLKIDAFTGAVSQNWSISPMKGSGGTYYKDQYVLGIQDLGAAAGAERYRLINWTTAGPLPENRRLPATYPFSNRVISNTTYALSALPSYIDWNVGIGVNYKEITDTTGTLNVEACVLTAYNLYTGEMVWNKTVARDFLFTFIADHGKIAYLDRYDGTFWAYDLRTGKLAWQSDAMPYPYDSWGAYSIASAYGMLFHGGYGAYYAFNWTDGKLVWKYVMPALAAFESPYVDENGAAIYPFCGPGPFDPAVVADGKIYVANLEHSPTRPYTRGWTFHCINATTGERIWAMMGSSLAGAIADGYVTASNSYDGYMYVYGIGQSATTVTAPDIAVELGASVMIKGTVMDMSPGDQGSWTNPTARLDSNTKAGTVPCVSDASMQTQMEYLYLQQPIDGIWHNATMIGVPVSLDAIDPNGNAQHIGDVTTDGYTGTFGFKWTPEIEGEYTITAAFMGTDSYGSSFATTYVSVVEAAAATPTPEPPQSPPDSIPYIIGIGIAILIAIAIVALLILRKR